MKKNMKSTLKINSLLDNCIKYSDTYTPPYVYDISVIIMLIVFNLHNEKIINQDKLKALFKQFHKKTLARRVNTYHCRVTDKWFQDCGTYEIWINAYKVKSKRKELDLETLIKYVNLLLNKNRNYCINWIYSELLEPIISYSNSYEGPKVFLDLELNEVTFNTYESVKNYLGDGYCCEDCDGCYTKYKQSQFEWRYRTQDLDKQVKNYLNQFKS